MSAALSVLIGFCVAVGLFFMSVGVIGILRFPDVYTRLHADTKATTFGSLFLGLASALCATQAWLAGEGGEPTAFWIHAAFAVVVLAVTNAVGGHAIARAAWRAGHKPVGVVDQLGAAEDGETAVGDDAKMAAAGDGEGAAGAAGAEEAAGPEEPEAPEAPEVPEEPEGAAVPEAPEAPAAPEAPNMAAAPEGPAAPDMAGESAAGAESAGARAIKWAVVDPEGGAV